LSVQLEIQSQGGNNI